MKICIEFIDRVDYLFVSTNSFGENEPKCKSFSLAYPCHLKVVVIMLHSSQW